VTGDQGSATPIGPVNIWGPQLLLRPLRAAEIEAEWQAMVDSDPIAITSLPDEAKFKERLSHSGFLRNGWIDLAIDSGGQAIGRIQTFVPPGRALDPGVFEVGIGLRAEARGRGYGREAIMLLTSWLFEEVGAARVEAPTDEANLAMRAVFGHAGWQFTGTMTESGREWVMYAITREQWQAGRPAAV
jgi:RimJ/RimL family protein N-acetyltransferase